MSEDQQSVDDVLLEMDAILAEEDPDFIKQLSGIKINNAMVDLSLMDQVLPNANGRGIASWRLFQVTKLMFDFKRNTKSVVLFWFFISFVLAALFFILKMKTWNAPDSLFLTSYAEWGLPVNSYNPMTESEMFFDNSRLLKNIVTIKKMVANIRPSESSGPNPMLAMELNVEGMTSEVVVEIKDREAEFKDLILRTAEDQTYDDLSKSEGKKNLAERILNVMNSNLTRGQIRKVLYKSFILKN